jgi:uncharacterized protein (TIGR02246 family)
MHIKGKQAIAGGHQGIFNTVYKETLLKTDVKSIRYVRPDIAIVHFDAHLTGISEGQPLDNQARITLTAEKTAGGWQIDAFQNTRIDPNPPRTK